MVKRKKKTSSDVKISKTASSIDVNSQAAINSLGKTLANIRPQTIKNGFEYSLLEEFSDSYRFSHDELLEVMKISSSTLERRRKAGMLTSVESDKIYCLMTILHAAENLFEGDTDKAIDWCRKPAKGLGGHRPLTFSDTTAGRGMVLDYIGRIEHGVAT